jgi:hypothetical protein
MDVIDGKVGRERPISLRTQDELQRRINLRPVLNIDLQGNSPPTGELTIRPLHRCDQDRLIRDRIDQVNWQLIATSDVSNGDMNIKLQACIRQRLANCLYKTPASQPLLPRQDEA